MTHEFRLDGQQAVITGAAFDDNHVAILVQLNGEIIEMERLKFYMRAGLRVFTMQPQPDPTVDPVFTKVQLRSDGKVITVPNGIEFDNIDNLPPIQI